MFRSARDIVNIPRPDSPAEENGPDLFGCDLCPDGGWVSETEVELHKTKEHYTRAFLRSVWNRGDYCCICVTKCESKEAVLRHIKKKHLLSSEGCLRVEREIFVCDLCSAVFFNEKNLIIHLRYSHKTPSNNETVMCILCLKNIRTRNIPAHFYMHQIQSVSTCRICLEKFRNSHVLEKHIRRHPLFLKCNMCQYETDRSDTFHDHVLETHKNLNKDVSLMTDDTKNRASLMTTETQSASKQIIDGSISKPNHSAIEEYCEKDDDDGIVTVIQICDDANMTDENADSKDLITVNDLISSVIKDELIDSDLMTGEVKQEGNEDSTTNRIEVAIDTNGGLMTGDIKAEYKSKDLMTDDTEENESKDLMTVDTKEENGSRDLMTDDSKEDNNITEDLMIDDVKDEITIEESLVTGDIKTSVKNDFRRFFIPKKSVFVKLQKVAGVKGLILTNDVHICVLCREICVGSEEMRLHTNEHSVTVKTEKKHLYECSCGEGFNSKVLLRHHTFKTKHVVV